MLKRTILTALVLASCASGALAQTQPSQPSQPTQPTNFGTMSSPPRGIYGNGIQMTLLRMSMDDSAQSGVTPAQLHRAYKAVSLIKANQCEDAYNMALTQQDYRLAGNVAVACKASLRQ